MADEENADVAEEIEEEGTVADDDTEIGTVALMVVSPIGVFEGN